MLPFVLSFSSLEVSPHYWEAAETKHIGFSDRPIHLFLGFALGLWWDLVRTARYWKFHFTCSACSWISLNSSMSFSVKTSWVPKKRSSFSCFPSQPSWLSVDEKENCLHLHLPRSTWLLVQQQIASGCIQALYQVFFLMGFSIQINH